MHDYRYVRVPWDLVEQSDLEPAGRPEYQRDTTGFRNGPQRQLAIQVPGQYVERLGLLCIRCDRKGESVFPLTMSIADAVEVSDE